MKMNLFTLLFCQSSQASKSKQLHDLYKLEYYIIPLVHTKTYNADLVTVCLFFVFHGTMNCLKSCVI